MDKKTIFTILAILILPILAFMALSFNKNSSAIADTNKPQIIKFSSSMCLECKEVEKYLMKLCPNIRTKFHIPQLLLTAAKIWITN